jgi:succinate-semialdehyde dehydrogenase
MALQARSINPCNGTLIAEYPFEDQGTIESKLVEAEIAFSIWSQMNIAKRGAALLRLADVLEARQQQLAELITREMGKPITASRAEVAKCADLCRHYAKNAVQMIQDEVIDLAGDGTARIAYLPLGIVVGVMPWNFPLWQVLRAAIPILAGGNCFILKHADNVQGSALALESLFVDAAFPSGTFTQLNIDHTALAELIGDPRIVGATVTAGRAAGSAIASIAGRHLKKTVLELGGSDPFIVLADADIESAAKAAVTARFQNCGQVCIAAKRIIVEAPVFEAFCEHFIVATQSFVQGDPTNPNTSIGPMARVRLRDEVHAQVEQSIQMGAKLLLGGVIPERPGAWYPPTILTDIKPDMPVWREEVFGPVASLVCAADEEEAFKMANDSCFGLSAVLWTNDLVKARLLSRDIKTGSVFINRFSVSDPRIPIGGIKESGYGRELSHLGIREFCNIQLLRE